jgi:hypothetical protein
MQDKITTAWKSFENVLRFKYVEKTVTSQNSIHEGIMSRLRSENASYYSDQNISSHLLLYVCVWNLVSHTKERTQIEGVWEQGS